MEPEWAAVTRKKGRTICKFPVKSRLYVDGTVPQHALYRFFVYRCKLNYRKYIFAVC